jgi:ribosomal protein S18 acetylase RimI-like enzyme
MRILQSTPEFLPPEVVIAEELIDAFLEDEKTSGYYIYIAEHDGEIAGYVCYGNTPLTEATWDLYWIAVDNGKQGFGIGRMLMKHAEDDIKRMHGRLVMVETSGKPDYNKTRQFYERLYYRKECQIADYYAPGDDLVLFSKKLG